MGSEIVLDSFRDLIGSLLLPGQTALYVKQVAKRDGGYYYPAKEWKTAKIAAGESWFMNTGAFDRERMLAGSEKPSASLQYCTGVLFLVLDDVGTKASAPDLLPTWRIETSPGCFQWGYAFSEQPTPGRFAAAYRRIAEAGFTDMGAGNAVRNCRLPGSVNLKPGRDMFEARVAEYNAQRRFTLDEILEALGIDPAFESDPEPTAPRLDKLANGSPVAPWLYTTARAIGRPNSDGWIDVVCPNAGEHSDGSVYGRYNVETASYRCFHSHCQHVDTESFHAWAADEGGPDLTPEGQANDMAERMRAAVMQLGGAEMVAAIKEAAMTGDEKALLDRRAWFDRYAWVAADDCYFDMRTRDLYPRRAFDALYAHVHCASVHNSKSVIPASKWFDQHRDACNGKVALRLTYAPGHGAIVTQDDGSRLANQWMDARAPRRDEPVSDKDVAMWLDHAAGLFRVASERAHLFDMLAWALQHPGKKINHAVLIGSRVQGTGKDTLAAPFLRAIGGIRHQNVYETSWSQMSKGWGYALESQVLLLSELREGSNAERYGMANNLKTLCAAPPHFLEVNKKGLKPYHVPNAMLVIAFTNFSSPMSLDPTDRRWFCLWSESEAMTQADATRIWNWYENEGGYDKVAQWLYQRDVTRFNPSAPAPQSDWKTRVTAESKSVGGEVIAEWIDKETSVFTGGFMSLPKQRALLELQRLSAVTLSMGALNDALDAAGWRSASVKSRKHQTPRLVYYAPRHADALASGELTKAALRDAAEDVIRSGRSGLPQPLAQIAQ